MTAHRAPLISVSMTTFNTSATVSRSIESILEQSVSDLELLISDAGSTDSTLEIVSRYVEQDKRVRILVKGERVPWVSLTGRALKDASGTYFSIVDSDDFVAKDFFKTSLNEICGSDAMAAMPRLLHCDLRGQYVPHHASSGRNFGFAARHNRFVRLAGLVMIPDSYGAVNMLYAFWKTSFFRQIGLWKAEKELVHDDFGFCLRALNSGRIAQVESTWICRTIPSSKGKSKVTSDMTVNELVHSRKFTLRNFSFPFVSQIRRFITENPTKCWLLFVVSLRCLIAVAALPTRVIHRYRFK